MVKQTVEFIDPWDAREKMKDHWEYMILAVDVAGLPSSATKLDRTCAHRISQLGADGWEMVSVTPVCGVGGGTNELVFTFKRLL